jgi:hypothetical protein
MYDITYLRFPYDPSEPLIARKWGLNTSSNGEDADDEEDEEDEEDLGDEAEDDDFKGSFAGDNKLMKVLVTTMNKDKGTTKGPTIACPNRIRLISKWKVYV